MIARLVFVGAVFLSATWTSSAMAACACGPDFCQNDARIAGLLASKKRALSASYPASLVGLLDKGEQCVARIQRSPDIFTILLVEPNGDSRTVPWSQDDQRRASDKLRNGQLNRFWIVHGRRAFSCCGQPPFDQMSDYDARDDVNTSLAIRCDAVHVCP